MTAREMKNAAPISQITLLPKPLSASRMPSVPVSAITMMLMMATPPIGRGLTMKPTTVATKIARRFQACCVTPSGGGISHRITPTATTMPRGTSFADSNVGPNEGSMVLDSAMLSLPNGGRRAVVAGFVALVGAQAE